MNTSRVDPVARRKYERIGWKRFLSMTAALCTGFLLAVYSSVFAQQGRLAATAFCAIVALLLSGYVGVTAVPILARRASSEWLRVSIDYQLTYEGVGFIALVILLAIAGLNTGNNLLFLVVACLLSAILMSGVLSLSVLSGLELEVSLPEYVFARRPVTAAVKLRNRKKLFPSFSITLTGSPGVARDRTTKTKRRSKNGDDDERSDGILRQPVYFPFLPAKETIARTVEIGFPRRGLYQERGFVLSTRFPFGFLEKKIEIPVSREVLVYPAVEPAKQFFELLPALTGEIESYQRGRGCDLYSIRDMLPTDSARFLDWKASARSGGLKVREYAREDERRLQIVFDRRIGAAAQNKGDEKDAEFEAGVELCACIAWHFHELDAMLSLCSDEIDIPAGRGESTVHAILNYLATVTPSAEESGHPIPVPDSDGAFRIVLSGASQSSKFENGSYQIAFDSLLGDDPDRRFRQLSSNGELQEVPAASAPVRS